MTIAKKEKKKQLLLSLEKGFHSRLKAVSRFEGRNMRWIATQLLDEYVKRAIEKNPEIIKDDGYEGPSADERG